MILPGANDIWTGSRGKKEIQKELSYTSSLRYSVKPVQRTIHFGAKEGKVNLNWVEYRLFSLTSNVWWSFLNIKFQKIIIRGTWFFS